MSPAAPPEQLVAALAASGLTVAVAESLTGGALVARLVDVPGASAVVRGGVVAYATYLKAALLGVDLGLLADVGPVHPEVARQMADGVRRRLGADVGIATTGVAGPAPQHGQPVGTVCIAVRGEQVDAVREHLLAGGRSALRESTVGLALALLRGAVVERAVGERVTASGELGARP